MTNQESIYWCESPDHPDWDLWDDFLQETQRGHYLQLSDWLKAYSVYGFSSALLIGKNEHGQIFGGLGIVKAGLSFIKLYIAPAGPIIREGHEDQTENFIRGFHIYSKNAGAAYAHINVPILQDGEMSFSLPVSALQPDSIFFTGKEGIRFKNVATISGVRWVDLSKYSMEKMEELLESLPSKTRRDIRSSQRKNMVCYISSDFRQAKQAYETIENAAKENGYIVRSWNDITNMLKNSLAKGMSNFVIAEKDGEQKGVIWLIKCGMRYTYMTGGSKREIPDLLTGYFLQWNALILSLKEGFQGYDISVGGTAGVLKFKDSFDPTYYPFIAPRYWIFSPWKFFLFEIIYLKLRRHKTLLASLLRMITHKK